MKIYMCSTVPWALKYFSFTGSTPTNNTRSPPGRKKNLEGLAALTVLIPTIAAFFLIAFIKRNYSKICKKRDNASRSTSNKSVSVHITDCNDFKINFTK